MPKLKAYRFDSVEIFVLALGEESPLEIVDQDTLSEGHPNG